jgi:hypothetical protein
MKTRQASSQISPTELHLHELLKPRHVIICASDTALREKTRANLDVKHLGRDAVTKRRGRHTQLI